MYADVRIACWLSDKKSQKTNWSELEHTCKENGFQIFKLNLNKSLHNQGPFAVLLHKMTDIIVAAELGDIKSLEIISNVEDYISQHPNIIIIDPICNVRRLLDRYKCYSIIQSSNLDKFGVFIPTFCEIRTNNVKKIAEDLKLSNVSYPFICKPQLGHGTKKAHQMTIIFNENDLIHCKSPCVAQTFINHNAILYKIFIVGKKHYFVQRPSLKNFYPSDMEAIFFDSSDVSKADSQSKLSILDPEDLKYAKHSPDPHIIEEIVKTLTSSFQMDLLGVDFVIENTSGKYAVIDVNAYPGYDGFPNFYEALIGCIKEKISQSISCA